MLPSAKTLAFRHRLRSVTLGKCLQIVLKFNFQTIIHQAFHRKAKVEKKAELSLISLFPQIGHCLPERSEG